MRDNLADFSARYFLWSACSTDESIRSITNCFGRLSIIFLIFLPISTLHLRSSLGCKAQLSFPYPRPAGRWFVGTQPLPIIPRQPGIGIARLFCREVRLSSGNCSSSVSHRVRYNEGSVLSTLRLCRRN